MPAIFTRREALALLAAREALYTARERNADRTYGEPRVTHEAARDIGRIDAMLEAASSEIWDAGNAAAAHCNCIEAGELVALIATPDGSPKYIARRAAAIREADRRHAELAPAEPIASRRAPDPASVSGGSDDAA